MPDTVEAVGQQIAAVGDHQHGSLIFVYQVTQTVEVFKVKENIGLVHYQQTGAAQHLADDLHQLQLTAAKLFKLQRLLAAKLCKGKLLADIDLIVVSIHSFALIQKLLIVLHHRIQIVAVFHLHAGICYGLFQLKKIAAQVVKHSDGLVALADGKLAHIADAAHPVHFQLSGESVFIRLSDKICQGGFACSVAADQGAVAVSLQSE